MFKKTITCLCCAFSINSYASSPLDEYIGKWAMPYYGCNDQDGMGIFEISKNNGAYFLDGYEMHFKIKNIQRANKSNGRTNGVSFTGVSDHRFDGDEDREITFLNKYGSGDNDIVTFMAGVFDKTKILFYCGK